MFRALSHTSLALLSLSLLATSVAPAHAEPSPQPPVPASGEPSPAASATPEPTSSAPGTPSATPSAEPIASATPTPVATHMPTPAVTPTPLPSPVVTPRPTPTPTPTLTGSTPRVSGELSVGSTLTAVPGAWTSGSRLTYTWRAGRSVVGSTQSLRLTATQTSQTVTVTVRGEKPGYLAVTRTSAPTLRVARASAPTVAGRAASGQTLTASTAGWLASTSFRYQWLADGATVRGATARTFKPTWAQQGRRIAVRVTGSKGGYATLTRTSAATVRVMSWSTPTITGAAVQGGTLVARPNAWTPGTRFTYLWFANGAPIPRATASSLRLGSAQRDKQISVRVTGGKAGHTTAVAMSRATARTMVAAVPSIAGAPVAGQTLSVRPGTWTKGTHFSYQWYANGAVIKGATARSYRVAGSLRDRRISVRVTGGKPAWTTVSRASGQTLRVAAAPTPVVKGTAQVGRSLSVSVGSWSSKTRFSYQWLANGKRVGSSSSLRLTSSMRGKRIMIKVTGAKAGYPTVTRGSAATAAVRGMPAPTKPKPVVRPTTANPVGGECPSSAPIKGNAKSMIYHVPGGAFYSRTKAEECFSSRVAAERAGYRASKR